MRELDQIVSGGYCIGCGACASAVGNKLKIVENDQGKYIPSSVDTIDSEDESKALNVCPFSNQGPNEDEISNSVFGDSKFNKGEVIGHYKGLYAGHVTDTILRKKVTSGGLITWMLTKLLESGYIDAVIHVKRSEKGGTIFEYGISNTVDGIVDGAKSRYYPVEISAVMEYVKSNDLRFAFVGLPCFVKSVRKYAQFDSVIKSRVKFFIGLVCGHLKSKAFAEYVGWQGGIQPKDLSYIDFRYKLDDRNADNYGIKVESKMGQQNILIARETKGTNWGLGYFKYEACDYCDDIFAETADFCVGDAWLKTYTSDSLGNSVFISRNDVIDRIIHEGVSNKELDLDFLNEVDMRNSQGGGFRHRRVSLAYRLYLKAKKGKWYPNKRVIPDKNAISIPLKFVSFFRTFLMKASAEYWAKAKLSNNYNSFNKKMYLPSKAYKTLLDAVALVKKVK